MKNNQDLIWRNWKSAYQCSMCQGLNTFDGAYICCKKCGGQSGEFVSVRFGYRWVKIFWIFGYYVPIQSEVRKRNKSYVTDLNHGHFIRNTNG